MKMIHLIFASTLLLASCSTGQYTASREYDDVYYSSGDKINTPQPNTVEQTRSTPSDYSSGNNSGNSSTGDNGTVQNERFDYNNNSNSTEPAYTTTDQQDGNTYITNNYYNDDDYYDYAYSSRLRRFYHPCGWGYYDTYYTNSYWYDYNPYSWGVSIYLGYNWWQPHYSWGPSWGFSMGYGYPGYAYDPWYSPYYNNYGYGYYQGYNNGFINGYYAGLYNGTFNPYYFNSYDSYSYYYGPRGHSSALNTVGSTHPISQIYANNITHDHGNTPHITQPVSAIQPFGGPKHVEPADIRNPSVGTVKGDVRDTRNGNNNTTIKNPPVNNNSNGDVRDIKGNNTTIKTPPSNGNIKGGNNNAPIKDVRQGNGPIKHNPENPDIKNQNNNGPIKNTRTEQPVKVNEHIYNEGPVRNPPVRNNESQEHQPVKNGSNDSKDNLYENNNSNAPVRNVPQRVNEDRQQKPGNDETGTRRERNVERQQRRNDAPSYETPGERESTPVYTQPRQSEQRGSNNNNNAPVSRPRR